MELDCSRDESIRCENGDILFTFAIFLSVTFFSPFFLLDCSIYLFLREGPALYKPRLGAHYVGPSDLASKQVVRTERSKDVRQLCYSNRQNRCIRKQHRWRTPQHSKHTDNGHTCHVVYQTAENTHFHAYGDFTQPDQAVVTESFLLIKPQATSFCLMHRIVFILFPQ